MKNEKPVTLYASVIFLFCISAMFSLSSCSKQSGTAETQPTPLPANTKEASQSTKMEGQSGNWKVTVGAIRKIPKEPRASNPEDRLSQGFETKFDILLITLDATYTGSSGNVESPAVVLVDDKGRKFETLTVSLDTPAGATGMPDFNDPIVKEVVAVLEWFQHRSKQKTRALKSGEKFALTYTFEDPKKYANLNLMFSDVPPFPLKVPQDEKGAK